MNTSTHINELGEKPRAMEVEQLVYFIRTGDIQNARRTLVCMFGRGERVSRDIIQSYQQLEENTGPLQVS